MTVISIRGAEAAQHAGQPRERLEVLRARAENLDTAGLMKLAIDEFPGKIGVISAFAAESVVLLHHVAQIDPTTPVLFLNTGKLFGETLRYRDRLQDVLGLTDIRSIGPHPDDRRKRDAEGTLWSRDPDACCHFRKVVPLRRALGGFEAIVTGRKRFQTMMRATLDKVELSEGRFRFNPLVEWSLSDLTRYIDEKGLPKHPLVNDGYPSIGCIPCTRRVAADEGYRDGRWAGLAKDECGIHAGVDGEGI
jgi:phosphoadenosine phosphosulfate reductase